MTLLIVLRIFFFNKVSCSDIDLNITNYDEFKCIEQKKQTQTFILKYFSIESKLNFIVIETINNQIAMQILSFCYHDFFDVFNKTISEIMLEYALHDHDIDVEKNMLSFELIYNLFIFELKTLREYLDKNLINDFIVFLNFSIDSSSLFVKKKNDSLYLCVNYRKLNAITIKNKYSWFLISRPCVLIQKTTIFTKLNYLWTYHSIRIRKNDEWKIAFRCRYEHYEYCVMLFELINASAIFQTDIYVMLKEFFNLFVIIYLNNILLFFKPKKEHTKHVRDVLSKFRLNKLYANLEKCQFFVEKIEFLRFLVNKYKIKMNSVQINTIVNWSKFKSHRNI